MITGSNTNVRYRGKVFHVQTEDSGRDHPHIISHVYHGGTILASEKSEYGESVDAADLDTVVKKLIGKQHRSMVKRLKSGAFDDAIAERLEGGSAKKTVPAGKTRPAAKPSGKAVAAKMRKRGAAPARPRAVPAPAAARREGADKSAVAAAENQDAPPGARDDVLAQRPLDEVILDYLVEKARSSRSKG